MRTGIKIGPKSFQERAARAGNWIKKTPYSGNGSLTETATNTAQALALFTLPALHAIVAVQSVLRTALKDASDAAFNTTTMSVGDSGSVNRNFTAIELNENGTEILLKWEVKSTNGIVSTSAGTVINATYNSMSAKSLVDIDTGAHDLYVTVVDYGILDVAGEVD